MTSRSRKYFRKKKKGPSSKDWVIDLWSEKICKEVDRLVLEEVIKIASTFKQQTL